MVSIGFIKNFSGQVNSLPSLVVISRASISANIIKSDESRPNSFALHLYSLAD